MNRKSPMVRPPVGAFVLHMGDQWKVETESIS